MNALHLASKKNLSETDCISILFQPALKLLTPPNPSQVGHLQCSLQKQHKPKPNIHFNPSWICITVTGGFVPSPVPPQLDQSENWSRCKPALLVGIKEPCNNSPAWKPWSGRVASRQKGHTKQRLSSSVINRRASAADKKVAGLPTPGSLIKRDNCSLAAWPLGITGTYS